MGEAKAKLMSKARGVGLNFFIKTPGKKLIEGNKIKGDSKFVLRLRSPSTFRPRRISGATQC